MLASISLPVALQRDTVSPLVDELSAVYEVLNDEPLLSALAAYRWTGRPGWSLRALWRAYLAAFVLNVGTTNDLIRRLQDDSELRELCGFDALPSRWTFGRFVSRLSLHDDLVQAAIAGLTDRLGRALPGFGTTVAVDSSIVRTWSDPHHDPISDQEATFTRKKDSKGTLRWFHGYKLHLAVDANYELPISATVTTASRSDGAELIGLVLGARERHEWFTPAHVLADMGYDYVNVYETLIRVVGAAPIIPIRNMPRKNPPDPADPRHFPPIARGTKEWKALYATRQSVERCFSRLKGQRALNSHCRRGLRKVTLHALMTVLSMQATALVRAEAGETGIRRTIRAVA